MRHGYIVPSRGVVMFDVPLVAVLMDADPLDVEESLDELVELGLVEFIGQRRYRLHDLLRTQRDCGQKT